MAAQDSILLSVFAFLSGLVFLRLIAAGRESAMLEARAARRLKHALDKARREGEQEAAREKVHAMSDIDVV